MGLCVVVLVEGCEGVSHRHQAELAVSPNHVTRPLGSG